MVKWFKKKNDAVGYIIRSPGLIIALINPGLIP